MPKSLSRVRKVTRTVNVKGADTLHMASPDASKESLVTSPGEVFVRTGVALVA